MFVVCEKWVETRTDSYIDPSSSLDHSSTSFASWVAQPGVTKNPMPSVCSWFWLRHPVSNWLEPLGHLVILFSNAHLHLLFFRIFTQVHLLIDGSVEGQYITSGVYVFYSIWISSESRGLYHSLLQTERNQKKRDEFCPGSLNPAAVPP